jgi:hypothetical protein
MVETALPDYVTDVVANAKLSPLEKLAWTKLSVQEFVDRLAPHVWRAPLLSRYSNGKPRLGRAGVSEAKVRRYISTYGQHFQGAKRKQVEELLYEKGAQFLHERCCDWAVAAFRACGGDIFYLQQSVTRLVPEGCRRMVLDTFSACLAASAPAINRTLSERKCNAVAHLSMKKADENQGPYIVNK